MTRQLEYMLHVATHNSPIARELQVISLMQNANLTNGTGNLVVNSLVVGSHSSLLERLGKGGMSVASACNVL